MLSKALRLILLRFLPRRVLPILTAIEIFRFVQRMRRRGPEPVAPRRLVTVDGDGDPVVEPSRRSGPAPKTGRRPD